MGKLDSIIKKHIVLTALSGLAVVLLMITITYGLYQTNHENTTDQEISLGDFDVDITSTSGQITLSDLTPGVENSATYTFTTSNSGDYIVKYSVYFTDNTTTFLADQTNAQTYANYTQITSENYEFIEYKLDTGEYKPLTDVYDSGTGRFTIITGRLQPNFSYNHTVKFKVSSNAPNSIQGSILALNITMEASVAQEMGTDTIMNLVTGEPTNSTSVITKTAPSGATCTNTFGYDNTVDNNLRYVGANPCNYVTFNGESPSTQTKWVIINISTNAMSSPEYYDTQSACQTTVNGSSNPSAYNCVSKSVIIGGWRIVGVFNNVDNGQGTKETRIKLVRNNYLGRYSFDTSASSVNNGQGVNDWTGADLKTELNGDYLNTSLSANTSWYNGQNNAQTAVFNYTNVLNSTAQSQIADAKWYLGGTDYNEESLKLPNAYLQERGTKVWGSTSGQTCNDGACPRATEWTGKVALMYPSDYGYATSGGTGASRDDCISLYSLFYNASGSTWGNSSYSACKTNNWITPEASSLWLLTPLNGYAVSSSAIHTTNMFQSAYSYRVNLVFPTIYLKSDVKITGGDGSSTNPYTLGL